MSSQSSISALFAADRHRELVERAEASRLARSVRRPRRPWAWLRRGRRLAPQPSLAPALREPDLAATSPLPAVASAPPQPDPAATLPLPALAGAAAGHQASPAG